MIVLQSMLGTLEAVSVVTAGAVLLGVGLAFVVMLTAANAKLKVRQDPTVTAIMEVLPGANCGGCGLAGCSAYAEAVVKDHGLMGRCGPGGEQLVHQIGAILGIEAAAKAPLRAVVHCSARTDDKIEKTTYAGPASCAEAQTVAGAMGCGYGCLGGGDCQEVCEFDAMHVIDGLAIVDYDKCVGCGACVAACPRDLVERIPFGEDPLLVIACATRDKAKEVRGYCKVGCVGCGLCAKLAPTMFQIEQNLVTIDYEQYAPQEDRDKVTAKCPRAMMVYVGRNTQVSEVKE